MDRHRRWRSSRGRLEWASIRSKRLRLKRDWRNRPRRLVWGRVRRSRYRTRLRLERNITSTLTHRMFSGWPCRKLMSCEYEEKWVKSEQHTLNQLKRYVPTDKVLYPYASIFVFLYFCIFVFLYFCIFVFLYFCILVGSASFLCAALSSPQVCILST